MTASTDPCGIFQNLNEPCAPKSSIGYDQKQQRFFTPHWKRPSVNSTANEKDDKTKDTFFPCVVCWKESTPQSKHKKCSQCHAAVYCSRDCQKKDYKDGKHKENCKLLSKLWMQKKDLESQLWSDKRYVMTGPSANDDRNIDVSNENYCDYSALPPPKIGHFWHETPSHENDANMLNPFGSTKDESANDQQKDQKVYLQQNQRTQTTKYCTCLLQMIQLLSRGESWRLKKCNYLQQQNTFISTSSKSTSIISSSRQSNLIPSRNPLALTIALNLALDLLYLDRGDMRVRSCVPSILIELNQYQQAYDYIKFWLLPSTHKRIVDLAQYEITVDESMMTKLETSVNDTPLKATASAENDGDRDNYDNINTVSYLPYLNLHQENIYEDCENWIDINEVYTNPGMIFELALIKYKLSCSHPSHIPTGKAELKNIKNDNMIDTQEIQNDMLRQAKFLLCLLHFKLNAHLLPSLILEPRASITNQIQNSRGSQPCQRPAAVQALLSASPPGMDLQYRMGNPGGGSKQEAIGIWQKDMVAWDDDDEAMTFLECFVRTELMPLIECDAKGSLNQVNDDSIIDSILDRYRRSTNDNSDNPTSLSVLINNLEQKQKKEAIDMVDILRRENPKLNLTAERIMMHPKMVELMAKHLKEKREFDK